VTNEGVSIVMSQDSDLDLGGLILYEMGQTVQKLRFLTGTDRPFVELGDGVTITIEDQDAGQPWQDRICRLQEAVCAVVSNHPGLDADEVCKAILRADGWSWTRVTFRTPMWMLDHDEILRPVVARKFEVLGWLARSSSEIK